MPHAPARLALLLLLPLLPLAALGGAPPAARAQSAPSKEAPASVEGRVTDGGEGLPNVSVLLVAFDTGSRPRTEARARTDHEGRYRLTGVAPGRYQVVPSAPAFVLPDAQSYPPGHTLLLSAGDAVADINFRLTRGGVITGRVTDADGQPVISEQVHVYEVDKSVTRRPVMSMLQGQRQSTDDRGVYRIYGLPAGRYRVSAGQNPEAGVLRLAAGRRHYRRTFHPDAADETQARVVEVAAGAEVTNVDITLGTSGRTYSIAGRFVGPDGRPAPGVAVGFGLVDRGARHLGSFGASSATNDRGEFLVEGLLPGNYVVFAMSQAEAGSETYSDAVEFTVSDADVSGLEVKLKRGASVAGVVAIEGTSDRATLARLLREFRLAAHAEPSRGALSPPNFANVQVAPDGAFRVGGLRPGRLRLGTGWPQVKGLTLTRVEVGGVEQRDSLEVAEGAQLTNVRVVLTYGNSTVRGQINVTNGALAADARLVVFARRAAPGEDPQDGDMGRGAQVDARGRFLMQGLPAGEYYVSARVFTPQGLRSPSARQHVSVPEGGEVNVTLNLDLGQQ